MTLPIPSIALDRLGIPPGTPLAFTLLRERERHAVYRVIAGERRFVLKTFLTQEPAKEIQAYALLKSLCIPTLPVYEQDESHLVIEDLEASPSLRLAGADDMHTAWVGEAVAAWYLLFHRAGREYLESTHPLPPFLRSWVNELDATALLDAGEKLGIGRSKAWQAAIDALEALKVRYKSFPQTLNYCDFADENLAITREGIIPRRAVVFDYDLLSTGSVYSDYRNVAGALSGEALEAFQETYGAADTREQPIDYALSTIEGLVTASKRKRLPGWAQPLLREVEDGTFEAGLHYALESRSNPAAAEDQAG